MEYNSTSSPTSSSFQLMDLKEEIFREIFPYLHPNYIYGTLRCVCHRLKRYVEDYIQIGGRFILTNEPEKPFKNS